VLAGLVAGSFADVAQRLGLTRDNCPSHPSFTEAAAIRRSFDYGTGFLLALVDGQACGCVGLRRPKQGVCALEKLAVLSAARRKGLGRALVAEALDLARRTGAVAVEAGIIDSEQALAPWYEGLGFRSVRTEQFAQLPFVVRYLQADIVSGCLLTPPSETAGA
jgi:GNAT superfamily N-acetyltransferase